MADIGLNSPRIRHDRVFGAVATVTGIKYGHVVIWENSSDNNFRDVKLPGADGAPAVAGVCVTQTDPTNGTAVGDDIEICDLGLCEVLVAASQTVAKGDLYITSSTTGQVKKRTNETTATIVGRSLENVVSGSNVLLATCAVGLYDV